MKRFLALSTSILLGAGLAALGAVAPAAAEDTPGFQAPAVALLADPPNYPVVSKVTFCHATGSESNPYVRITTSVNGFFNAGHDTHQDFGDIVPPFSYEKPQGFFDFDGLNYGPGAQEFIDNRCADEPSDEASAAVEIVPADCEAAEMLILGDTTGTHASWGAYTDLVGPLAMYEVISTADEGFTFPAGPGVSQDGSTMTFTGSLDPSSPECYVEPVAPTLPATGSDSSGLLAAAAALMIVGATAVLRRNRKQQADA